MCSGLANINLHSGCVCRQKQFLTCWRFQAFRDFLHAPQPDPPNDPKAVNEGLRWLLGLMRATKKAGELAGLVTVLGFAVAAGLS